MQILHVSAECYPAAKVGGLADVVGSLPKYLNEAGEHCEVIIPKYELEWMQAQAFETVFEGTLQMGDTTHGFSIQKLTGNKPGFPFYVVEIPGRFDRPGIYIDPNSGHGYWDEFERFLSFQIAVLEWVKSRKSRPDIIHCHDHHTGLIPFMSRECHQFSDLASIPIVITVHNAEYQGTTDMKKFTLLPEFDLQHMGLLEWDNQLNSLAAGLKCAWRITTVSENYMKELSVRSNGLEDLFAHESRKSLGIVNGIDTEVWNPATDLYLDFNFNFRNRISGKRKNKEALCEMFGLNSDLPTISFIGRLVREKGADLLPDLFKRYLQSEANVNFILLGTGEPELHQIFETMQNEYLGYFDATLKYNEKLAHQIYAGSDFIFMPSRVEPCGLNQMFAMRYGTIPVVRGVGGLKDTVKDISETGGYGIVFNDFTLEDAAGAVDRAIGLFQKKKKISEVIRTIMKLDFSWKRSAKEYLNLYNLLIKEAEK